MEKQITKSCFLDFGGAQLAGNTFFCIMLPLFGFYWLGSIVFKSYAVSQAVLENTA